MITTTHIVTNAFAARRNGGRPTRFGRLLADSTHARAFVIGGFAPDVGLYALTAGAAVFYPVVRNMSLRDTMQFAFDDLFFNNPVWIVAQNTLHSPVVVLALATFAYWTSRTRLLSFALGCLLHTAVDIPVHHNDGPLVFFPFDWDTRVNSPVSYYDADHYGSMVAPIDFAITLIGGSYLLATWWKRRQAAPGSASTVEEVRVRPHRSRRA